MDVELTKNDLKTIRTVLESATRGEYLSGEHGGEKFVHLSNGYTYEDAKRYFASAIIGEKEANDPKRLEIWWNNYCRKARKEQFERTYAQFEKWRNGEPIKIYRGLVVKSGTEIDLDRAGECWSFSRPMVTRWVDGIWDTMVYNHIMTASQLEDCQKYVLTGMTTLDNCRLAYSFWLAGRFERPEWEVRLANEQKIRIISRKEVD
jgi:hypothetical protein